MLYRELREWAIRILKEAPVPQSPEQFDTPEWDARLLLEKASGLDRAKLFLAGGEQVPGTVIRRYRRFIAKRAAGMPVAYMTKTRFFYELEFEVSPAVLIPRADTETLVEEILNSFDKNRVIRVLDLCTGSGCVAASVKNARPQWLVSASDISTSALKVAGRNFRRYRMPITVYKSNLLKKIPGRFEIIAANPPYISEKEMKELRPDLYEPERALTDKKDGLSIIREILRQAPHSLSRGGKLLIEAAPHQMKFIRAEMEKLCYNNIGIATDAACRERVIYGYIN